MPGLIPFSTAPSGLNAAAAWRLLGPVAVKDKVTDEVHAEIGFAKALCGTGQATTGSFAVEEECCFVYYDRAVIATADIAALRRAGVKIRIGTRDEDELDRALGHAPLYGALGSVYPARLNTIKWDQQGLERVAHWTRDTGDRPLVGITAETAADVFGWS